MSHWPALIGSEINGALIRHRIEPHRIPQSRRGQAVVWLCKLEDCRAWAQTAPKGEVIDRGRKRPSKPLAIYMPDNGRCAIVEASYQNPGQTERGVHAFLAAALLKKRTGTLVMGIDPALFDLLWARAADGPLHDGNLLEAPVSRTSPSPLRDDLLDRLLDENANLVVPLSLRERFVGDSPAMERIRRLIVLASRSKFPVLIEGETGTGKEIVAHQIHELGQHPEGSFVPVNCGGISEHLLESELFGHVKGAFTGAIRTKIGHWKQADHGTLFLDEIGDMPLYHQVKVLRALECGQFHPVGSVKIVKSAARVVAATHRDLRRMVVEGRFREDLFYRLFALRICTLPLREHPEDIPQLAVYLWRQITGDAAPPLAAAVLDELQGQPWPGNARELRAFLSNLAAYADGRSVTASLARAILKERGAGI